MIFAAACLHLSWMEGGLVWAVNAQLFFQDTRHQTATQIGQYMSWVPAVGGSLGALLGGFVADRVVRKRGLNARMLVMVISNLLAAPFALGALLLPPPYCYISLLPSNILGEMWIGATLAVVTELVPAAMRTQAVAAFMFISKGRPGG